MTEDAPDPVTVPSGEDPWAVLKTMQAFMPGVDRGQCEIVEDHDTPTGPARRVIGYTVLIGNPERKPQPIFDTATRVVEVVELGDWLKARGFEASACRWVNDRTMLDAVSKWRLITGEAKVPPMPPEFPVRSDLTPEARADRDIGIRRRLAYARR